MALVVKRSDVFPVGTVVKAYAAVGGENRHNEGTPTGAILAEATVAANGELSFTTLAEGLYELYAEVAGVPVTLTAGSVEFTAPGTLLKRVAAERALAGC